MVYGDLQAVFPLEAEALKNADWFRENDTGILLVSGIANPGGLRAYAESIRKDVRELKYPDHHRYTPKDIEKITQLTVNLAKAYPNVLILTTEKDAVKLRELDLPENVRSLIYAVPLRVEFLNGDEENFDKQIYNYVKSNKRSSVLHKKED